jgi:hypothetical protein
MERPGSSDAMPSTEQGFKLEIKQFDMIANYNLDLTNGINANLPPSHLRARVGRLEVKSGFKSH